MTSIPHAATSEARLEQLLSEPTTGVVDALSRVGGDIIVLGAGGKMGPSLARLLARRAGLAEVSAVDFPMWMDGRIPDEIDYNWQPPVAKAVLLLMGSGHLTLLRQLAIDSPDFCLVDTGEVLGS